jgi:hypothetical protein
MSEITLLYQFVNNKTPEFVFIVNNKFFTKINWGDGTPTQVITNPMTNSYHKYKTKSIYKVTFTSLKPIPYKVFTSPLITNGYGYLINCDNNKYHPELNIHDTVKIYKSFSEQGYASDKTKKIKDKTIFDDLTSKGLTIRKPYSSYESQLDTLRGAIYCKYNSIYVFQL